MSEFLFGMIIGFSVAAPVGPIGLLCIRRTLVNGRLAGFFSGLGAASADALYSGIAAFGVAAISSLLIQQQLALRLIGGLFLVYLGIKAFFSPISQHSVTESGTTRGKMLLRAYFTTFFLTLANPLTILSFVAIYAGLGLGLQAASSNDITWLPAVWLIAGVFSGSALWWLVLSQLAGWLRSRWLGSGLVWINRLSGLLIIGYGIAALLGLDNTPQDISSSIVVPAAQPTPVSTEGYAVAYGVEPLIFPRDHGAHPDFQTEWWYYTGNLRSTDGSLFGYQLTFFRRALIPPALREKRDSAWATDEAYLAHFALTDVGDDQHYAFERLERGSAGIAGAISEPFEVWLENWQVVQVAENTYRLQASVSTDLNRPEINLDLILTDTKGPVLQGDQGYSRKGSQPGNASYYYSLTRLSTDGTLKLGNQNYSVSGFSWMDHEYSTSYLSADQVGWDWFSIQLDNGYELMLFQIRGLDGSIDPFSNGTLIAPDGSVNILDRESFEVQVTNTWQSAVTGASYPAAWEISIPQEQIILKIQPLVADQEMNLRYKYWEGAASIQGSFGATSVSGIGYVELTGYAGSMGGEF